MIWLCSDLHLGHDREFVWKKRGFSSCEEMNNTIYDLQGRRVENPKQVEIYIQKGKKIRK